MMTSLVVAAFDIGSTFSGYAYSFQSNPSKVLSNQVWGSVAHSLLSLKTPTCLLLTPTGEFHSFGFEAENDYTRLAEEDEHHGWRLFRRFKMMLYNNKNLTKTSTVEDITGRPADALNVFSMSIHYLRQHFLTEILKQATSLMESDVQYVITVPAIWDDKGKQFMREAAVLAGMDPHRTVIALEPEAASVWCKFASEEAKTVLSGVGSRYMVIDLGGGTADISVHESQNDGKLQEIHQPSGGPWGGINVDDRFMCTLEKLFNKNVIDILKNKTMSDYLDLVRDFEAKKRSFLSKNVTMKIPVALQEISQEVIRRSLKESIEMSDIKDKLKIVGKDKIKIDSSVVAEWFNGPIDLLIGHVKNLLEESNMSNIRNVFLVGGFSESPYLQERMKKELADRKCIVLAEAGLAVVKGAVLFGHNQTIIESRISTYSYGVAGRQSYDENIHSAEAMIEDEDGKKQVRNAFVKFIAANEVIKVGHELTISCNPGYNQNVSIFRIYCSTNPNPVLVTDPGCEQLGTLRVEHSGDKESTDKTMKVTFIFGDTEVKVKVLVVKTGEEYWLRFDCLGGDKSKHLN